MNLILALLAASDVQPGDLTRFPPERDISFYMARLHEARTITQHMIAAEVVGAEKTLSDLDCTLMVLCEIYMAWPSARCVEDPSAMSLWIQTETLPRLRRVRAALGYEAYHAGRLPVECKR